MATQWVEDLLRGGLPAVLDWGDQVPPGEQVSDPERSPPTDVTGRENANPPQNFLASFDQAQVVKFAMAAAG